MLIVNHIIIISSPAKRVNASRKGLTLCQMILTLSQNIIKRYWSHFSNQQSNISHLSGFMWVRNVPYQHKDTIANCDVYLIFHVKYSNIWIHSCSNLISFEVHDLTKVDGHLMVKTQYVLRNHFIPFWWRKSDLTCR